MIVAFFWNSTLLPLGNWTAEGFRCGAVFSLGLHRKIFPLAFFRRSRRYAITSRRTSPCNSCNYLWGRTVTHGWCCIRWRSSRRRLPFLIRAKTRLPWRLPERCPIDEFRKRNAMMQCLLNFRLIPLSRPLHILRADGRRSWGIASGDEEFGPSGLGQSEKSTCAVVVTLTVTADMIRASNFDSIRNWNEININLLCSLCFVNMQLFIVELLIWF